MPVIQNDLEYFFLKKKRKEKGNTNHTSNFKASLVVELYIEDLYFHSQIPAPLIMLNL